MSVIILTHLRVAYALYSQATYKSVTASFTVPTPKAPGSGSSYSASAWVGIDGDTYGNSILQTGLDFTITNGKVSYDVSFCFLRKPKRA